ncbi:hypothetical protein BTN50_0810 [Candidatus Enterovibrio altilux]|uniref:Uncharacterized protein n=1 Tax=Candidatus Enterovibrio altilux TaxID=1927128 RepID=A0A291B8J7_9GAMM|nr:hypothetical protein BTN50_0810 [Candidatus Enterovibrio luxaltus]
MVLGLYNFFEHLSNGHIIFVLLMRNKAVLEIGGNNFWLFLNNLIK